MIFYFTCSPADFRLILGETGFGVHTKCFDDFEH